jgi:aspartate-semialdehyde dehydrogenase
MSNSTSLRVAVVGATGAAGSTVLRILQERRFPVAELRPLASARSAGTTVLFAGDELTVQEVSDQALQGVDIAFFAAGSGTAKRFAPVVAQQGGVAIDKSSGYRMDPDVPLVVPEVNGDRVTGEPGIVANPNCVAIPLTVALNPLHHAFGLKRVTVATYQSASGGGRNLINELREQEVADAERRDPQKSVYPHVLHGNVVPGGWSMHGLDNDEEVKVVQETRRVLGLPDLRVSVSTVRVPVTVGHSGAVWVEFERPADVETARDALATAPGVRFVDDPDQQQYPTPRAAAGTDEVWVGRLRPDPGNPGGLAFFWSCDNLRKGAATNAVQVGELVLARRREASAVA